MMNATDTYKTPNGKILDAHMTKQHFSTKILASYLKHLEINHPSVDPEKICERAGLPYEYVCDTDNWVSVIFSQRFINECIKATNDPDLSFKAGKMSLTEEFMGNLLYNLAKYTLSTSKIYRTLLSQRVNFSKISKLDILESKTNFIYIKHYLFNFNILDTEEKKALLLYSEHINQNLIGYIKAIPTLHGNSEAKVYATPKINADGYPELYLKIKYHDKRPVWNIVMILLFLSMSVLVGYVGINLPDRFILSSVIFKLFVFLGIISTSAAAILFIRNRKLKKWPAEARKTIEKLDEQYNDLQSAKEKIDAMNLALQKADKLKDEFLSNTSHELRTPLYGIIGIAESLVDGAAGNLSDSVNENLLVIINSGKRLVNLVNDILDKIDKGYRFSFTIPVEKDGITETTAREERLKTIAVGDATTAENGIEIHAAERMKDRRARVGHPPLQGRVERRTGLKCRREKPLVDNLHNITVLAVDDEPVNLQIIENNLKIAGAQVHIAHSGSEALEKLKYLEPDLILMDIIMPRMNGYDVAKNIRQTFSREELPIIFLTAKNQVTDLVDGFSSGCNDYITKPLSRNELLTRIKFHVGLSRSRLELKKAEEKYRTIIQSIEEGYFEVDLDGHFIFLNDAMYKMIQLSRAELSDLTYRDFLDESIVSIADNILKKVHTSERPIKGLEVEFIRKNGVRLNTEVSISLIKDNENKTIGFRGIIRDVTLRKEKEKEKERRKAAEIASKTKSEFLANMSHEIRTPMNAIIGFCNLALKSDMPEKRYNYLKKIKGASHSLLSIINDILDFSKIEAGKLEMENIGFQLPKVIDDISAIFSHKIKEKGLYLKIKMDEAVPLDLTGDPTRLGQVLVNLVSNAVKFTQEGGVEISIRCLDQTSAYVLIEFSVKDTGIGIDPENIEGLFDAFTQADSTTTRKFGGTGLGLAICRHLVELMNGEIRVESASGQGSDFIFTARFGRLSQGQTEQEFLSREISEIHFMKQLKGAHILLVEDEIINQEITLAQLSSADMTITVANNGSEAISAVGKNDFDCILMDIQMPGMNGYDVTRKIRQDPRLTGLPIIAMTAHAMKEEIEKCLDAGMNDHITKPVDESILFSKLAKWVHL